MAVIERTVPIVNSLGLHARPAAEFVKLASRFRADIQVRKADQPNHAVNGKSIMGVLTLAAECGSQLHIRAEGEDADEALVALMELVSSGFGEE
jgi:phosphocarrier protein